MNPTQTDLRSINAATIDASYRARATSVKVGIRRVSSYLPRAAAAALPITADKLNKLPKLIDADFLHEGHAYRRPPNGNRGDAATRSFPRIYLRFNRIKARNKAGPDAIKARIADLPPSKDRKIKTLCFKSIDATHLRVILHSLKWTCRQALRARPRHAAELRRLHDQVLRLTRELLEARRS